jgi:hypothetical protein
MYSKVEPFTQYNMIRVCEEPDQMNFHKNKYKRKTKNTNEQINFNWN